MNTETIIIFTDGSSRGNPGPGGYAAIVKQEEQVTELGGREMNTTNNRMELSGALKALQFVHTKKVKDTDIKIYTDSSYLINGITKWVKGWIAKGWITSTKEPVINKDLWEELIQVVDGLEDKNSLSWIYVKGHAGIAANERVDEIATLFADGQDVKLFHGSAEKYTHDVHNITIQPSGGGENKKSSREKRERSQAKAYSYLSLVGGKLERHMSWKECEARVKGAKGAKFKKALSEEEEQDIIKAWTS